MMRSTRVRLILAEIYSRVSAESQAEKGISLDAQIAPCTQYVLAHGLQIVDIIIDARLSEKTTDRFGLQKLLKFLTGHKNSSRHLLEARPIELFYHRHPEYVKCDASTKLELRLLDSWLVDPASADGKLFVTLCARFAQTERRKISEQTRAPLDRKQELGRRLA